MLGKFLLSALVDEAGLFDLARKFPFQRTGLEHDHFQSELESGLHGARQLIRLIACHGATPNFDRNAQGVERAGLDRLDLEVANGVLAVHEILDVGLVDVYTADLEEPGRARAMADNRENREGPVSRPVINVGDVVTGIPAQERRNGIVPQRRHHQNARIAFRRGCARGLVDDFDVEQIGPKVKSVVMPGFASHGRPFGAADLVV